jgi:hypothetical protein
MPLHWQRLSPQWSGRAIAERVLESLVVLYGVEENALFVFADTDAVQRVRASGLLEQIEAQIFRLPEMIHPVAQSNDESPELAEDTAVERVLARSGEVREILGSVDEEVVESIIWFADDAGIGMPYIPSSLVPETIELFDKTFGSRARPIHPDPVYFFRPLIAAIYQGEWTPRITFGRGGDGVGSEALTYQLVLPGIAVLWQVRTEPLVEQGHVEERWRVLTDRTRRLVHLFRRHRSAVREDGLLLIVHSELHKYSGGKLVTWDDLSGFPVPESDGFGARNSSLEGTASVDAVFDAAEKWLRAHG